MREAVIVSTARTGLAKSWRGSLNMTHGATMGGHVVKAALERAGIEAASPVVSLTVSVTPSVARDHAPVMLASTSAVTV